MPQIPREKAGYFYSRQKESAPDSWYEIVTEFTSPLRDVYLLDLISPPSNCNVLAIRAVSALCPVSWDIADINIMKPFLEGDAVDLFQSGNWSGGKIF